MNAIYECQNIHGRRKRIEMMRKSEVQRSTMFACFASIFCANVWTGETRTYERKHTSDFHNQSNQRGIMSSKPFLITGATGSIGRNVVEFLIERGHKVRAFVHKGENNESSQLQQLGAEIVVGDLLDFMTIRPALDGISGACFVYPIVPGIVDATAYFAQAAK
jgi:FlaA1/EpsC-like NDP-sugar epimerase